MKAKKSYGQHFLVHDEIAQKIAQALPTLEHVSHIIEVGPGKGKLTQFLLKRSETLHAIEADREMIEFLHIAFHQHIDTFIPGDFLCFNPRELLQDKPYFLIGNYPYNISSQIVFRMLAEREYIPVMVGMFQKEVADRIISQPGSKVYGVTSVLTQAFYDGEKILTLKPGHFNPPPKVHSSVIKLVRKPQEQWIESPYEDFRKMVKSAFGMRRKMLRNSLSPYFSSEFMEKNKIFTRRPEKLSVSEFDKLTLWYLGG